METTFLTADEVKQLFAECNTEQGCNVEAWKTKIRDKSQWKWHLPTLVLVHQVYFPDSIREMYFGDLIVFQKGLIYLNPHQPYAQPLAGFLERDSASFNPDIIVRRKHPIRQFQFWTECYFTKSLKLEVVRDRPGIYWQVGAGMGEMYSYDPMSQRMWDGLMEFFDQWL